MANEFKVKKGLIVDGSNTVLDVQGTQGQLFSVTDSLTGDLFSVSDISGVPIFNVNSSGAITADGDIYVGSDSAYDVGTSTVKFANIHADDFHGTFNGNLIGNAGSVSSIGNLTGHITSANRVTSLGSFTTAELNAAISDGSINSQSIPSGNAVIDWTADQGNTNIHANNVVPTYGSITGITSASTFAGTAATADKWTSTSQLSLDGDVSGNVFWDGSGGVTLTCTVANDSHFHSNYITSNANDNVTGHTEWQDNKHVRLGNDGDMRLYHNASDSYIDNNKGHLYIRNNVDDDDGGNIYIQAKSGENGIIIEDDSTVSLYNDNSKKFETTSAGITVSGNISVTGTTDGVYLDSYPDRPNQLTYQTLVAHFSQTAGSTSAFNIPMNNTTESTTATYYHFWTAPFNGRVKTMIMKHGHGTSPDLISSTPTKFGVAVNGTSADYISSSFLTRVRVEGRNDDYYSYIKDDDINETFNAGDRVYFQFINSSTSVRWRNCSVSIVVEYNIT